MRSVNNLLSLYYLETLILTCGVLIKGGNNAVCLGTVTECAGQYCVGSVKQVAYIVEGDVVVPHRPHPCCLTEFSVSAHIRKETACKLPRELHGGGVFDTLEFRLQHFNIQLFQNL